MKPVVLIGMRFGHLLVRERAGTLGRRKAAWKCLCDCGAETIQRGDHLRSGAVASCGCERVAHGHTRGRRTTPTYRSWAAAHARCEQPTTNGFERYGGRGIAVCARWSGEQGFENFLADMGERPEGMTLDRFPNPDGNYEPGNCRWATPKEQRANRSGEATAVSA